ncbi:hypothetical protein PAHAL_8G224100 [Panicum hallii]|uniref:RING-CH-type domain-containing protein n=1 Tax=Panicum hallii TaxID=206008 RepID=A0A2S3IF15_9POAL|nr:uncharacterized protein LOC112903345 [Panicum hallii]PAN43263.1 hypothetical protein PAHAL_8G224100 [Panicum hallii]
MAGQDHVVVDVDGLAKPKDDGVAEKPSEGVATSAAAASPSAVVDVVKEEEEGGGGEEEPLIQAAECRICQEEDSVKNLEKPCACSGSLKYAHRACVQRWCNEKGDTTCEICHQEYKPGYTAPPRVEPDETTIDIDGDLIMDPRILAVAAAQRRLLEAEYDGYATTDASGAAFCRSAALILMALLLLRHALSISDNEGNDDDASTMFSLFLLRAAGFLLPCYIMAWIFSILHRRRQRQEEAALAAAEVAFILQSARGRALQFAPESPATPQQEQEPSPQQQ